MTANVYVPKGDGPFPVVLGTCGHSNDGKAEPAYQMFAAALARQGFVTMIYDPVSQGERHQYEHLNTKAAPYGPVYEHQYEGHQLHLTGDYLGTWRTWDGIRGLDYLLSRNDADKSTVGVTGNSGGGTLTTFLTAFDGRITMAAPSCFVTTTLRNLENELPADSEQYPPGMLAAGLDIADFYIAYAPRPTILLSQKHDFFDCRGMLEIYDELKRIYRLLGAEDNILYFFGPDQHGYTRSNREAMVNFFCQTAGIKAPSREPQITTFKLEQIAAAPGAKVSNWQGNRFLYELNAERASQLAEARPNVTEASLQRDINKVLGLSKRSSTLDYRILRPAGNPSLHPYEAVWRYGIETEPGIQAILQIWDGPVSRKNNLPRADLPALSNPTLYVPDQSSLSDMTSGIVADDSSSIFAVDLRGFGESTPLGGLEPDTYGPAGTDYMISGFGVMLDQSYLGRRVHDLLCVLDVIQTAGNKDIHLIGRGNGAIIATFAALLHSNVRRVTLINTLLSYDQLAQKPLYSWALSSLPRSVLRYFDLPDCYRALAAKQLKLLRPWDENREPLKPADARKQLDQLGLDRKILSK